MGGVMSKIILSIFCIVFSTSTFSGNQFDLIKETVKFSEYENRVLELMSKYQCANETSSRIYPATMFMLSVERLKGDNMLINQFLSQQSLQFIEDNLLEMNSIHGGNNQIICVGEDYAIVMNTGLEQKDDGTKVSGWVVVKKYSFLNKENKLKFDIPKKTISTHWYSLSESIAAIFYNDIDF